MSEPDVSGRDIDPREICRCGQLLRIRKETGGRHRFWARCHHCGRYVANADLELCLANIRGDK